VCFQHFSLVHKISIYRINERQVLILKLHAVKNEAEKLAREERA